MATILADLCSTAFRKTIRPIRPKLEVVRERRTGGVSDQKFVAIKTDHHDLESPCQELAEEIFFDLDTS
jgi:hypothetical protein